jgi:AcrR family transcriptional regulator
MSTQTLPTRQRLIQAALQLFADQGISTATTRKIADLAEVNEVTLFRQFGNKYGLLLAVLEEASVFQDLGQALVLPTHSMKGVKAVLKAYAHEGLDTLERIPALVRSVVGEADQYPAESRRALGQGLSEANRSAAQFLAEVLQRQQVETRLSTEKLASLLNSLLLGYVVLELTSEFQELWQGREDFLDHLIQLFLYGAISGTASGPEIYPHALEHKVLDLPASVVHDILRKTRKLGAQDYALAYVLFAAGVSGQDIVGLERSHQISDTHQHILQVGVRQIPVNQWVMGKRYGSYTANPLTRWLKSRKDHQSALFLDGTDQQPITSSDIESRWQIWTEEIIVAGSRPTLIQAQQTWFVDMVLRGISLENLSLFSGLDSNQLQPYAQRAREILAIAQATRADQKPSYP